MTITESFLIEMLEATTCGDIRSLFWDDETLVGPKTFKDQISATLFAERLLSHPNYRFVGYSVRSFMVPEAR